MEALLVLFAPTFSAIYIILCAFLLAILCWSLAGAKLSKTPLILFVLKYLCNVDTREIETPAPVWLKVGGKARAI